MKRDEPDKALGLYEALLQPELTADLNFEGLYNSAVILARMGGAEKTALALDRFSEARKLQPDFLDVDLRLAALDYASGSPRRRPRGSRPTWQRFRRICRPRLTWLSWI